MQAYGQPRVMYLVGDFTPHERKAKFKAFKAAQRRENRKYRKYCYR